MPSSPNRHRIEIPAPLYATIAAQAQREGRPVAALVVAYLIDGMSLQEHYGQLDSAIADLRREVRHLTRAERPAAVAATGSGAAMPAHRRTIESNR